MMITGLSAREPLDSGPVNAFREEGVSGHGGAFQVGQVSYAEYSGQITAEQEHALPVHAVSNRTGHHAPFVSAFVLVPGRST